jgi:hypothetical protein
MLFNSIQSNNEVASFERLFAQQIERADRIYMDLVCKYCTPFFTHGDLDAIVLLYKMLGDLPFNSARVVITTYSITEKFVNQIAMFKRAGLINYVRLITSSNLKTLQPNLVGHVNQVFDEVKLCEVHAKVITVSNSDTNITVISSLNLTRNNKPEAGFISVLPQHFIEAEAFYNSL